MKLGTSVTTPDGKTGTINRRSDSFGCRMYRLACSDGEHWYEAALLERA